MHIFDAAAVQSYKKVILGPKHYQQRRLPRVSVFLFDNKFTRKHTRDTCIVRLDVSLLHFAILDHEGIPLTPHTTKYRCTIETEIQSLSEFGRWVAEEANLTLSGYNNDIKISTLNLFEWKERHDKWTR